jgi:hypothetical protein
MRWQKEFMIEKQDYISREMSFSNIDLLHFYLFTKYHLTVLRISESEWSDYLRGILPLFSDKALEPFSKYFVINRMNNTVEQKNEAWLRFDSYFGKSFNESTDIEFFNLSATDQSLYIKERIQLDLKPTMLKHLCKLTLNKHKIGPASVDALYKVAASIGLRTSAAIDVFKRASNSQDETLRLIENMDQTTQIYSYLYSLKVLLENDNLIDNFEKKSLISLKKQFSIEINGSAFWREYISILEENYKRVDYIDEKKELLAVFAAFNLIAFEDRSLSRQEREFIHSNLESFNLNKTDLSGLKDFEGRNLDSILSDLTVKGRVFLVIKSLELILADREISDSEAEAISGMLKNIIESKNEIKDAEELYLLFIHTVMNNPSLSKFKEGEFLGAINALLKNALSYDRDLTKTFYLVETFLNSRGIHLDEKTLKTIFMSLGLSESESSYLVNDCLRKSGLKVDKTNMLLAVLKAEVLLTEDSVSPIYIAQLRSVLEKIPAPGSYEKNAITYFVLRSILLDSEIQDNEVQFFEELTFSMRVDQSVIYKFISSLYFETAIRFNFTGWIDYAEFLDKKTKRSKAFPVAKFF